MSVFRIFGIVAAVLVVATALADAVPAAKPQQDQVTDKVQAGDTLTYIPDESDYRSACTEVLTGSTIVYPGDVVTVTAKAQYGGVCAYKTIVWMSYAVDVEIDGTDGRSTWDGYMYNYCYWGVPQPVCPDGLGVYLEDGLTHTLAFHISEDLLFPVPVILIENGAPCGSNPGNTKNIYGPGLVMCGEGGTVGWSTVKFFEIQTDDDPGSMIDDYDGDGKADPARYEKATGTWKVKLSASAYQEMVMNAMLGGEGWDAATSDYDGDGRADPAVYCDDYTNGNWSVMLSSAGYAQWDFPALLGGSGYIPVKADFDGDGFGDPSVYNESAGIWKIQMSSLGYDSQTLSNFGGPGYAPVPGDYDGDGKTDPAVYKPSTGTWIVLCSASGYSQTTITGLLGGAGWVPAVGDYDGDGRADPTVHHYATGEWRILLSGSGYAQTSAVLSF